MRVGKRWKHAMERRGMIVSRRKTKYICVDERKTGGMVKMLRGKVDEG